MSRVADRFIAYARIDSPSDQDNLAHTPSTPCQFDSARIVAKDLEEMGADDVAVDEHAYVTATIPASKGAESLPALLLCAHHDVTPDVKATGVKPHIVHYEGGTLHIGFDAEGNEVTTDEKETPGLVDYVGQDVICSDGTTLLGSDDKGAVAEIVELAARLLEDPSKPHPTLKLALVPDEEIGHGARLLDIGKMGCRWGYTVDGERVGKLNYECFNASMWDVTARGLNVHPGIAKNVMVNAVRVLEEFDMALPAEERPQYTEGYEGFFHMMSLAGDVNHAMARYIVRDHDAERFAEREQLMRDAAAYINKRYGKELITLSVNEQYRNMAEVIKNEGGQCLIDNALAAIRDAGVEPEVLPIRGGTDGAQLTYRGLLCPNITNGGLNHHSIKELQSVQSMEKTVEILEHLVARFAVPQKA